MKTSYKKLWKMLIDRDMKKKDFRELKLDEKDSEEVEVVASLDSDTVKRTGRKIPWRYSRRHCRKCT